MHAEIEEEQDETALFHQDTIYRERQGFFYFCVARREKKIKNTDGDPKIFLHGL